MTADECRPVNVDGAVILVRSGYTLTDADREQLAVIVEAAKARAAQEPTWIPPEEAWRAEHADAADATGTHPLVVAAIAELAGNMGFDPDEGLPAYGVHKVARYAAQVARAQALGIPAEWLRPGYELTRSERRQLRARLRRAAELTPIPIREDTPA